MNASVLRFLAALFPACLLTPALAWLILVCADFAGLENSAAPHPSWRAFALLIAAALAFPPAFRLWPDRSRSPGILLREGCRATLLAFAAFALLFLLLAPLVTAFLPVPKIMLPLIAEALAPLLSAPLVWLSYALARALAPRPGPSSAPPPAMRAFSAASLGLTVFPFLCMLASQEAAALFPPSLPCLAWAIVIYGMRRALAVLGDGGVLPAWGASSLLHLFWLAALLPEAGNALLVMILAFAALEIFTCACLLTPSCRRWLVNA
ncbi:hypothetical protein [uncultured Mailhella sp.]|uniref:hypothetical protein n=1 Tax=uncultured Mailhella sp. TaxID=1981031 RepID=UPI002632E686|nr:hypothetical protein [uncultured Mailhella sp.]